MESIFLGIGAYSYFPESFRLMHFYFCNTSKIIQIIKLTPIHLKRFKQHKTFREEITQISYNPTFL